MVREEKTGKMGLSQLHGRECSACRPRETRLRAGGEEASVTRGTLVCPHPHMPEPGPRPGHWTHHTLRKLNASHTPRTLNASHTLRTLNASHTQDTERITHAQDPERIAHAQDPERITHTQDTWLGLKMVFSLLEECKYANVTALSEEMKCGWKLSSTERLDRIMFE